jgi:antitoxin PrlF
MKIRRFIDVTSRQGNSAMSEYVMTMTQRSQVTVPAEVRRVLGLKPRDRVAFEIKGAEVRLRPAEFTLETAFGSVEPLNRPEDFEEISRLAKEEHVERAVRKMRRG